MIDDERLTMNARAAKAMRDDPRYGTDPAWREKADCYAAGVRSMAECWMILVEVVRVLPDAVRVAASGDTEAAGRMADYLDELGKQMLYPLPKRDHFDPDWLDKVT